MYVRLFALEALLAILRQSIQINAAVIPRQAQSNFENPASALLDAVRGLDTSKAGFVDNVTTDLTVSQFRIAQDAAIPLVRSLTITTKQLSFLYGPPVAGGPSFPTGLLGLAKTSQDSLDIQQDEIPQLKASQQDNRQAEADESQFGGLDSLDDYTKIYESDFKSIDPNGPYAGSLTNFTQDLFFSMERLADSPYQIRRLNPSSDSLQFQIDDSTANQIAGSTLNSLLQKGRLFYADYRDQKDLPKTERYGAACDAYFYIDEASGDFLPLAIRTNVGANLIYTPLDPENDWLLAKIMLNGNDFWFSQWMHLAQTHQVVQIAYMAAIRTLSEAHPVLAFLNRLMFEVFSIQPLAKVILFTPGMLVDEIFPYTGPAAQEYTTNLYNNGAGRFKSNYFEDELRSRGLIGCEYGPHLKNFPFYEDAKVIHSAQREFMTSFVDSFYSSDKTVKRDNEIQNWVREAQGVAQAIDFPDIRTREDLIDVMTHFVLNTNQLLDISSVLPFHTPALYKPLPTAKNVTDVADYLPPFEKVMTQMTTGAVFARPKLVGTDRSLIHQFDAPALLSRMNKQTTAAAAMFKGKMEAFSAEVSSRTFDAQGLSQGMPFVWKALDPNVAPYSITT